MFYHLENRLVMKTKNSIRLLIFSLLIYVSIDGTCQTPTWQWVKSQIHSVGNTNACVWPRDIAVDPSDNILSCGYYAGESVDAVTFDGINANGYGTGAFHYSGYIAKYNTNGVIQWVARMGSGPTNGDVVVNSITSDPSGNVFAAGKFTRTARFGGQLTVDAGGVTRTSVYSNDAFIIKYNPSGVFQWISVIAAAATPQGSKSIEGIRVSSNAIFVVGTYSARIEFGSGISLTSTLDGASYSNDIFIAKYDLSGNCIWARSAGSNKTDYGWGMAIDATDNIYFTGTFQSTANFGGTNITSGGGAGSTVSNIYLAKYDTNGNRLWVRFGSSTTSMGSGFYRYQIGLDNVSSVFITGFLPPSATVNFGSAISNASTVNSMFVTKFSTAGTHNWTRQYTATGGVTASGISASGSSVFVGGSFIGVSDFGNFDLTPPGWGKAVYVMQLDNSTGDVLSSAMAGGNSVTIYDPYVCFDHAGNLIVGGLTYGIGVPKNFSPYSILLARSTGYVAKINNFVPLPVELIDFNGKCTNGIVSLSWTTASEINSNYFEIQRSHNAQDWTSAGTVQAAGNSNTLLNYSFVEEIVNENTTTYYRLIEVDYNSFTEEFEPIVLQCNTTEILQPTIYPNPVEQLLTIHIPAEYSSSKLQIYSVHGELVFSEIMYLNEAQFIQFDFSFLNSGIYELQILSENNIFRTSLVKQ